MSTNNGIYRSDDYGNNWELKNPEKFLSFTVLQKNIIGISESGIFISDDSGETWLKYEKGLNYSGTSKFAINKKYMYAIVDKHIFRKSLMEYPLSIDRHALKDPLFLFPNPASEMIYVNSPWVRSVEIINLQGQTVMELNNNINEVDISALKKGVYIIRLHFINGEADMQKMVKK
ncbi:MAG: T9SS type A sorting domain-containing protein [Prolixibacteraceae bacterium]|nr:T9SS type A sorting domain-containing protein [Prolixibacteraceae bacterium]